MSRIFLGLITHNQYDNIRLLTDPIWEHINGIVSVDAGSTDGTRELLEERKGEGEVLYRKWTNNHSLQMNVWLRESVLKEGDWVIIRDSCERFSEDFAQKLRQYILAWDFNGVRSIWNYGKLFAFKWADHQVFQNSPHWRLDGLQNKMIELRDLHNEDLKEWTWRVKDGEPGGRPIDNKIDHEAKYYWVYGESNHLLLGREDNIDEYKYLDAIRVHIREQARIHGFEKTLDGLRKFMEWMTSDERDEQTRRNGCNWINGTHILRNFYRKHILCHKWEDIEKEEATWKLELN